MQDLKKRTKLFSLAIIELCSELKKTPAARILGNQLLRSATSIGANYREADAAFSRKEFAAKAGISLKEASETCYWLELLIESGSSDPKQTQPLLDEATELTKIFFAISNNAKRQI